MDPYFVEEPDSDYDFDKDLSSSQTEEEGRKTRGRRSVTMKRTAVRRSSRSEKPAKTPKVQMTPKLR